MKTISQFTSLDAFLHITPTHLAKAQATVWDAINALAEATDREIADYLTKETGHQWGTDRVRPRRVELHDMGRIMCTGERINPVTHKRAMVWRTVR